LDKRITDADKGVTNQVDKLKLIGMGMNKDLMMSIPPQMWQKGEGYKVDYQ
jgi:hypothetical protein